MPWLLQIPVPREEGRHEGSVPGEPGTRAAASGTEHGSTSLVPLGLNPTFSSQILLLSFEVCASQS